MKIIYRISDAGYKKVKSEYIKNESCLANADNVFKEADGETERNMANNIVKLPL